jgi:hypothetical protein
MPDYEQAVLISYAWGGENEKIVNQLDQALQERGLKIIRDKRDLGYKGSIKTFMERIGKADCVIVVISDKYLRSPNCMFELVEIADNKEFENRIFPIVLADADIYKPVNQLQYIKYWEAQIKELNDSLEGVGRANLQGIYAQLDLYDRIRYNLSKLTAILSDMNTLTPAMHNDSNFESLYDAIVERMKESTTVNEEQSAESKIKASDSMKKNTARSSPTAGNPLVSDFQNTNVSGGINIQGRNVNVGGDVVGGNKTVYSGESKKANPIKEAFERINQQIDRLPDDLDADKSYLKMFVKDIEREVSKGDDFNEKKLKNSFRMLEQNSADIYSKVANLLKAPDMNVPLEIQNLVD